MSAGFREERIRVCATWRQIHLAGCFQVESDKKTHQAALPLAASALIALPRRTFHYLGFFMSNSYLNRLENTTQRLRVAAATGLLVAITAGGCAGAEDAALEDGSSADEAAPTTLQQVAQTDGWNPGECDEVYRIAASNPNNKAEPYSVAPGRELNINIRVDPPWGNEQVQAIAFKPYTDNKKVLHHWILNARGAFLAGWAPGDDERPPLPKDVGIELPVGTGTLGLNLHYYNKGSTKAELDRSGVDICVLKGANRRPKLAAVATSFASIGKGGVLAPARAKNAPITSSCTLTGNEPVHLLTAAPHAHKYASHMKFTVKKKNGEEIIMHDAPFRFGEQGTYPLPGGEIVLTAGDTVTTTCSYTNPTDRNITFGESTENEMCFNFAAYYPKGALKCSGGLFGGALPF